MLMPIMAKDAPINLFNPYFDLKIKISNKRAQIGALPIVIAVPKPTPDFKTAAKNNMLYNIINRPENAIKIGARKIQETSFCPKITAITNR